MATTIKRHMLTIWPVSSSMGAGNLAGKVRTYTEEDSQSFVYGAPLVFDTSTTDVKLATDTNVNGIGLAIEPASGTGGTELKVLVFNENIVFRAPVLNAGAAAANNSNQIGNTYSFVARTDGYGYGIDTADTGSNDWFKVIDIEGTSGTNPGYVFVTVLPAVFLDMNVA